MSIRAVMKNLNLFILWFCFTITGYSQSAKKSQQSAKETIEASSHSYASSSGEQHSEVGLEFPVLKDLNGQLEVFYDTYLLSDRLRVSFRLKKYITEKTYLFAGSGIEAVIRDKSQFLGLPLGSIPRLSVEGGLGHELKEGFLIEAKGNFSINNSNIGAFGEPLPMPKIYTLGGKWKF